MHEDAPHLDGAYAAFGAVLEGMDVIDRIASVETDWTDRPIEAVIIEKWNGCESWRQYGMN